MLKLIFILVIIGFIFAFSLMISGTLVFGAAGILKAIQMMTKKEVVEPDI